MSWTGTEDDQTRNVDGYTLRAEKMDSDLFWWCVYKGEVQVACDVMEVKFARTMAIAKYYATAYMIRHKKLNPAQ